MMIKILFSFSILRKHFKNAKCAWRIVFFYFSVENFQDQNNCHFLFQIVKIFSDIDFLFHLLKLFFFFNFCLNYFANISSYTKQTFETLSWQLKWLKISFSTNGIFFNFWNIKKKKKIIPCEYFFILKFSIIGSNFCPNYLTLTLFIFLRFAQICTNDVKKFVTCIFSHSNLKLHLNMLQI